MVSSKSKNIFIIPARSGSKGIKNKNTQLISGIEMFVWSIIHAKYLSKKNDLNDFRYDYFKVPQINETHVLNYFFSELKNSIKI